MLRELDTDDWREAFGFANNSQGSTPKKEYNLSSFAVEDVTELYGLDEGENDGESWCCLTLTTRIAARCPRQPFGVSYVK